jgi:ATP-dependent DNA ligase
MKLSPENIEHSCGSYVRSKPECIPDLSIVQLVDLFKRSVAQRFVPLHPRDLLKIKPTEEKYRLGNNLHVSIKVDGESMVCVFDEDAKDEKSYFCNASVHRVYYGLPINREIESILRAKGVKHAIVAGELVASESDPPEFDGRLKVSQFLHYSKTKNEQDLERFGFRVFDLIELNKENEPNIGNWLAKPYQDRYKKLHEIFPEFGRVALVRTTIMNDLQLAAYFDKHVLQDGHEGIVIRSPINPQGYKIKPVHTIDVVIIGAVGGMEGTKIAPDQIASALVALRYADGTYQIVGNVGGGLTDDQRREIWQQLEFVPHTGFVGTANDGRAYQMVNPKIVAAIDYIEMNSTTYNNQPIFQHTLSFNPDAKNWEVLGQVPFVSLVSPRFSVDHAIREDKTNNINDVRISQVTELTTIEIKDKIEKIVYPKSTILAKYVYEKGDNVRKFLAWETNKIIKDDEKSYPKYVVAFTDYSVTRASPIERDIKVTNYLDQMWDLLDNWIREEILDKSKSKLIKGWSLYSSQDSRPDPPSFP